MDRMPGDLDGTQDAELQNELLHDVGEAQAMLGRSEQRLGIAERLFNLAELESHYDQDEAALWTFMRPSGRPSFTPGLLADFELWQLLIGQSFGPGRVPLKYLVLGSRAPGVFCYGGDLALFHSLITAQDREGLVTYGKRCVDILDRNIRALELPVLTIGLVQGAALGGGFEALLSFDHIIAERGSTFGLPEVMFGLFPGMGAHAILSRKLGAAQADRMIQSNEIYSAEALHDLGLVHQLAPEGEGIATARAFVAKSGRRHNGLVGARRAARAASPITMDEFYRIVELWADTALQLSETDLRMMQRLVSAQSKVAAAA